MNDLLYNKLNKKLDNLRHTQTQQTKKHGDYTTETNVTFYTCVETVPLETTIHLAVSRNSTTTALSTARTSTRDPPTTGRDPPTQTVNHSTSVLCWLGIKGATTWSVPPPIGMND
jgi:hypothetical protein